MPLTRECSRCEAQVSTDAVFCHLCGADTTGDESREPHARLRERLTESLDGRYRVLELLGAGGMGVVFLAEDLEFDRKVAIKVLLPELAGDANVVERFGREARTAAGLDHAGIVRIYHYASDRGLHYFVMQYVEGRSLQELLHLNARPSLAFATRVLWEAAGALAHAHQRGVVHRDVKPENIMMDAKGRVLLTDFGISKVSRTEPSAATTMVKLTGTGGVVGTPHYMAPEHALGQAVDGRTDQYALAVVGFQMLTGRVPFDDETAPAIIHLHINSAAPQIASFRDDVSPHLTAAIARAMSKAPSHRFATIEDFATAIASQPPQRPARWRAASWAATVLLAGGLAGGSWWTLQKRPAAERPAPNVALAGSPAVTRAVAPDKKAPVATRAKTTTPTGAKTTTPAGAKTTAPTRAKTTASPASTGSTRAKTAAPAAATTTGPVVTLNISSMPAATLFVDGKRIGQTPIKGHRVIGAGDHPIRLERTGYVTLRETIKVTETRNLRRYYGLRKEQR